MSLVNVDRRVLGAIRCVDANTNLRIEGSFRIESAGLEIFRNRQGDFVLARAHSNADLDAHTDQFQEVPSQPALGSESFDIDIVALNENDRHESLLNAQIAPYLPRRISVDLPRDPDPANSGNDTSLFHPIVVRLLPSLSGPIPTGGNVVRAIVTSSTGDPIPGALIRVTRMTESGEELIAVGMTHWSGRAIGEAIVPITAIPLTTWDTSVLDDDASTGNSGGGNSGGGNASGGNSPGGDDVDEPPVISTEVATTIHAIWDPNVDLAAGMIPDPEDLELRRNELSSTTLNVPMSFGQYVVARLTISDP